MYSEDEGRPCFPVKIIVSLEILKHFFDISDKELLEVTDLDTDIQRMDSTMVKANIKHLSRIQLMCEVFESFI